MSDLYKADLYRAYGETGLTLRGKLFTPPQMKYLKILRCCQRSKGLALLINRLKLKRLEHSTQIQIPYQTKIGAGLSISHFGRIIVNPEVVIGKNVTLSTGVVLGQENRGKRAGSPTIGDCVVICPNAVVVGKITVGNDVIIAPNAYVNFDVPDHSIVVGNPGKIIHKDEATKGYIGNLV